MRQTNTISGFLVGFAVLTLTGILPLKVKAQTPTIAYNYVANMFTAPNESDLNWYGSGDVNNDNVVNQADVDRLDSIIAGTFSDPSDGRLMDRADVNGDEVVNNSDKILLQNKVNGTMAYLPGEWNKLQTRAERENWFGKMVEIDKTDQEPPIIDPVTGNVRDCNYFELTMMINNNIFTQAEIDTLSKIYSFNWEDHNRFNLPVQSGGIVNYNPDGSVSNSHAMNVIALADNILEWNKLAAVEPQDDVWPEQPGDGYFGTNSKFIIRGSPIMYARGPINNRDAATTPYVVYLIAEGVPSEGIVANPSNVDLKVITQRDKTNPSIDLTSPQNGAFYNTDPQLVSSVTDESVFDMFNWKDGVVNGEKEYYNPYISSTLNGEEVEGEIFKEANRPIKENISDGVYTFNFNVEDDFYNPASESRTFTIDKTPVSISTESPIPNNIYASDVEVRLEGVLSDKNLDLANSHYTLNGNQYSISDSTLNISLNSIEGSNILEIIAQDKAGNVSSKTINYEINQAPVNEIDEPLTDGIYYNNIVQFKGRVIDNNFALASYSINDEPSISLSQDWDIDLDLVNGDYELVVSSEDDFGETDADTINFTVDKPTSIEITEIDNNISIYPNPTHGFIRFNYTANGIKELNTQIFDLTGRKVAIYSFVLITGENQINLDLSDLNPGIYMLNIVVEQQVQTIKLVLSDDAIY